MRMLASRTRTRPRSRRLPSPRSSGAPGAGASLAVVVSLKLLPLALLRGRLHYLLRLRVSLEARRGLEVPVHRIGGNVDQARVRLRRPRDPAGDLVEEELHDGEEALQVRLLIYREVYVPCLHELEDLGQEIVPSGLDALVVQPELLHHLRHALGAPRIHGEYPGHV